MTGEWGIGNRESEKRGSRPDRAHGAPFGANVAGFAALRGAIQPAM